MPNIWVYEAINSKKAVPDGEGLGICCENYWNNKFTSYNIIYNILF